MAQYIDLPARRSSTRKRAGSLVAAQGAAALLIATAGALRLNLWFDYFHRVHVVGALFLAASLLASRRQVVAPLERREDPHGQSR